MHLIKSSLLVILILSGFFTLLSSQSFSYAILPSDTAIIIQQDYCGDTIQWQQLVDDIWVDLEDENSPTLQLTNDQQENEVKQFRALIRFANDPIPKVSEVTNIRFATFFSELEISDFYNGAHLYYVSPDTLLAAIVTNYSATWGCYGQIINGADGITAGTGQQNTLDIINDCQETNTAAFICDTLIAAGHEDWYLPSTDEANLISANLSFNDIADFGFNDYIWTSTEAWSTSSTVIAQRAVRKLLPYEGFTYNYANKSDTARIIASRTVLSPAPFTVNIDSYLEEDALVGTIAVTPVVGSLSKFVVEYIGNVVADAEFEWDFRDGLVLEGGTGPGPHLLSFTFGGYRQLSVTVTSGQCVSSTYKSTTFQPVVVEDIQAPFPEIYNGKVAFVDYDNDSFLDAFLIGSDTSCLYRNTGQNYFELIDTPFPPLSDAHCSWGDYDNDGWSDVVFCGITPQDSIPQTYLFRNSGGFQFTETQATLPGISNGFVQWIDYNNDGTLDLLLSGRDHNDHPLTQLLKGDKTGNFTEVATPFPLLLNSGVALEDYNQDNFTDLLLFGKNDTNRYCILYQNQNGTFIAHPQEFVGIDDGAAAWADFNDDGLLDFYVTGNQEDVIVELVNVNQLWVNLQSSVYGEIYLQDETGYFSVFDNPYIPNRNFDFSFNSLETGDFDNDGKSDILTTGMPWIAWLTTGIGGGPQNINDWPHRSKPSIFRNRGDGFTNLELNIPATYTLGIIPEPANNYASDSLYKHLAMSSFETSSATFGDFNNDGNIDIFREGNGMDERSAIYQHEACVNNTPPSIPIGLNATIINCDSVRLDWEVVDDDHTLTANISYELYLGTSPGSNNIISRKNIRKLRTNYFELSDLEDGIYYWSVKAVDNAKASSAFAAEGSFEIDCLVATKEPNGGLDALIYPNPFQHSFTISLPTHLDNHKAHYEVTNPLGQVIEKDVLTDGSTVILSDKAVGVYFIKLTIGSESTIKKLVRKK